MSIDLSLIKRFKWGTKTFPLYLPLLSQNTQICLHPTLIRPLFHRYNHSNLIRVSIFITKLS